MKNEEDKGEDNGDDKNDMTIRRRERKKGKQQFLGQERWLSG